ncbi:hypothetical protein ABZ865_00645 [Streptomyces sp. NPDC047085]|uniref:hypothetical protein n=1 Tax=Streptomyces sp. NPDC047085 TaxID=3155140 RepID=UPI00340EB011
MNAEVEAAARSRLGNCQHRTVQRTPIVEEAARTITRAGWWIDQRSSEPGDLTELLEAATGADRPTENPHF